MPEVKSSAKNSNEFKNNVHKNAEAKDQIARYRHDKVNLTCACNRNTKISKIDNKELKHYNKALSFKFYFREKQKEGTVLKFNEAKTLTKCPNAAAMVKGI